MHENFDNFIDAMQTSLANNKHINTQSCGFCGHALTNFYGCIRDRIACHDCYYDKLKADRTFIGVLTRCGEIHKGIAHPTKIAVGDYILEENMPAIIQNFPNCEVIVRYHRYERERLHIRTLPHIPEEKIADVRDISVVGIA